MEDVLKPEGPQRLDYEGEWCREDIKEEAMSDEAIQLLTEEYSPITYWECYGPASMYDALGTLSMEQLHTLVKKANLDAMRGTKDWKDKSRLKAHIIIASENLATKGYIY